jgi:hypothetical protein
LLVTRALKRLAQQSSHRNYALQVTNRVMECSAAVKCQWELNVHVARSQLASLKGNTLPFYYSIQQACSLWKGPPSAPTQPTRATSICVVQAARLADCCKQLESFSKQSSSNQVRSMSEPFCPICRLVAHWIPQPAFVRPIASQSKMENCSEPCP